MRTKISKAEGSLEVRVVMPRPWLATAGLSILLVLIILLAMPLSSGMHCEWLDDGGLRCERVTKRVFWTSRRVSPVVYPGQEIAAYMYPSERKSHANSESCGLQVDGETHFLPTACDTMVDVAIALNAFLQTRSAEEFERTYTESESLLWLVPSFPLLLFVLIYLLTPVAVVFRVELQEASFVMEQVFTWPRSSVVQAWDAAQVSSISLDPLLRAKGTQNTNRIVLSRVDPQGVSTVLTQARAKHLLVLEEVVEPLNLALAEVHEALSVSLTNIEGGTPGSSTEGGAPGSSSL